MPEELSDVGIQPSATRGDRLTQIGNEAERIIRNPGNNFNDRLIELDIFLERELTSIMEDLSFFVENYVTGERINPKDFHRLDEMVSRYGGSEAWKQSKRKIKEDIEERFQAKFLDKWKPNYNAAPSQTLPIILNESPNIITAAKWGLIPPWAKQARIADVITCIKNQPLTP